MKEEALVGNKGADFSTPEFKSADWYSTTVPTTALATLVRHGIYPDPYIGTNMMLIPDVNDAENKRYDLLKYSHLPDHSNPWSQPYWFRTDFTLPASDAGKTIWLHLDGINYRADVWFNGQQVASANDIVGMFRRFTFDVSKLVHVGSESNALAVRIHELDIPGDPVFEQLGGIAGGFGRNAGDGKICANVTMYQTAGWDWIPSVRDRNIGLWQNAWLEATGPVAVRDPAAFVDPKWLPGHDAPITVRGYTDNPSSAPMPVKILTRIEPQGFTGPTVEFSQQVQADPGRHEFIFHPADHPELWLHDPQVWWPVTYGEHPLYKVTMTASTDGTPSSSASSILGVRTVGTYVLKSGGRAFTCNGRTIRVTGGAWIPDMLLSWSAQRYRDEVRLMAEGNHTVVRVNGCGIMPPEVFFDACDRNGLLVWEDFSRTSSGTADADKDVLMANMTDFVDRARSHPSLLVWEGSNESLPQQNWGQPMQDQVLPAMDGTRPWLVSSSSDAKWAPPIHMRSGGPYALAPLKTYFDLYQRGGSYTCKNEIGMACPPPLNSLDQAIPDWDKPDQTNYPLNVTFGFHDATSNNYQQTHDTIRSTFGPTPDLMQYLWLADLYTGTGYRAIYEAANKARPLNSGTHLWKVNAAWPSMMWQLFDWYLRPNAGYYGMKEACKPLHVQHSIDDNGIQVVSTLPDAKPKLQVQAEILSPAGKAEFTKSFPVDAAADATTVVGTLADQLNDDQLHFLALTLTDANGQVLDRDVRWVQKDQQWGALQTIASAIVTATVEKQTIEGDETAYVVAVENSSDVPTANAWVEVLQGAQGREVLPSFWSDNALTLLPHEKRELTVRFRTALLAGAEPHLLVEGFNAMPREISVATGQPVPLSIKAVGCEMSAEQYRGVTIDMSFVNAGTAGPRFTSWPIPIALDGVIIQYVHLDVRGTQPSHTTVAFRGLTPGEHTVTVGYPDDPASIATLKINAPSIPRISLLPVPVTSKVSEPGHPHPERLFDAALKPDMVATNDLTGYSYATNGNGVTPVVWTDYGKSITAGGLVYAQREDKDPMASKVYQIKLWFYPTETGNSAGLPDTPPDETVDIPRPADPNLNYYPFAHSHQGRCVVMQFMGKDGKPGGAELRLVAP